MDNIADLLIFNTIMAAFSANNNLSLFGEHNTRDIEAFSRSYIGNEFPEIWFEMPLSGKPWYDLHILTARKSLEEDCKIPEDVFYPKVFSWFAASTGVRQLAVSHDLSKGIYDNPAVQLLVSGRDDGVVHDFLAASQKSYLSAFYDAFMKRRAESWYACYFGTFPSRSDQLLRIECIPKKQDQISYASDARILAAQLESVGYKASAETLELINFMAALPFPIEFQFDVTRNGTVAAVMSASLRFSMPGIKRGSLQTAFLNDDENVERLMKRLCDLGLSDERWKLLPDAAFAKRLGEGHLIGFPAFIKVRFNADGPVDAKAYLMSRSLIGTN